MTSREAYRIYLDYYKNNQWTGEDAINYLKKNWIDYEGYDFNEFENMVLTNDKFNKRWGNGCTVDLSLDERFKLWDELENKDVMDFPIGELTENQYHEVLTKIGIPARKIIKQ
jgi:hypothetical protein